MKKFLKLFLCIAICLTGGIFLASCGKKGETNDVDSQIMAIYTMAVNAGETRTYEEWLTSIKGADGKGIVSIEKTSSEGLVDTYTITFTDGTTTSYNITNGQDASIDPFNVIFDYGIIQGKEQVFFNNSVDSMTIEKSCWITNLPTIKNEYSGHFLGWYIAGTDIQIKNYNFIGGDITLEARYEDERIFGLSGLYQHEKLVKTWSQLKNEFPNAFSGTAIVANGLSSYFYNLSGDFVIDEEITTIGEHAFYNCADLTEIAIPDGVISIELMAFSGCTGLTEITIPNSVTSIGIGAFYCCGPGLRSITIGSGITSIGEKAFEHCEGLRFAMIDSSVVADGLMSDVAMGSFLHLSACPTTIYIKTGLETSSSTYLLENFTKQAESDKDGYDMWTRNAE